MNNILQYLINSTLATTSLIDTYFIECIDDKNYYLRRKHTNGINIIIGHFNDKLLVQSTCDACNQLLNDWKY